MRDQFLPKLTTQLLNAEKQEEFLSLFSKDH